VAICDPGNTHSGSIEPPPICTFQFAFGNTIVGVDLDADQICEIREICVNPRFRYLPPWRLPESPLNLKFAFCIAPASFPTTCNFTLTSFPMCRKFKGSKSGGRIMQYIRYRFGEKNCWGRLEGDSVVELSAAPWMGDAQEVRRFIQEGEMNLLPPCEPTKIICVGKNYYDHIKELHPGEERPTEPLLFMKPTSALLPPGGVILMPPQSERVDYEGELAVVLGKELSRGDEEQAINAIFGYTLANDVTARDLQRKDGQWTRGKGFDTFCPVGPALTTHLMEGASITTRVNDEIRQQASLQQMIFPVPEILSYISQCMTLYPGDIVLTGTPEGVGPLADGDVVAVEIPGIGLLRNSVQARKTS
jgi:2-keto-4-pentenoate hydratase/2-oxohepta-3-ene-1,7-dioic acid hydratase in catechol pathway